MEGDNRAYSERHYEHAYSKVSVSAVKDSCLDKALQSGSTHVKLFGTVGQLCNVLEQLSSVRDPKPVNEISNNWTAWPMPVPFSPEDIQIPKSQSVTLLTNNNAVVNGDISGTREPFLNEPTSRDNNTQTPKYDKISKTISQYKGMFSVEQHFVCLICCTCLKTDYLLGLHLQVHINKQETNISVSSSRLTVEHSGHVLAESIDMIECDDAYGNTDSENDDTPLFDNPKNMADASCLRTNFDIFPSTKHVDLTGKADHIDYESVGSTTKPQQTSDYVCLLCQSHFISYLDLELHSKQKNCTEDILSSIVQDMNTGSLQLCTSEKVESVIPCSKEITNDVANFDTPNIGSQCHPTCRQEIINDSCSPEISSVPPVTAVSNQLSADNTDNPSSSSKYLTTVHNKKVIIVPVCDQVMQNVLNKSAVPLMLNNLVSCGKLIVSMSSRNVNTIPPYRVLNQGSKLLQHVNPTESNIKCNASEAKVAIIDKNIGDHSNKATRVPDDGFRNNQKKPTCKTPVECYSKQIHLCETCGKILCRRQAYIMHVKQNHSGKQSHHNKCAKEERKCHLCQRRFLRNCDLERHIRTHPGERPYMCAQCGQLTSSINDLKRHMMIHSDVRPHICSICNKAFKRMSSLSGHMTIHTGEKRYKCENCPRLFSNITYLRRHKERKHGSRRILKTFGCIQCRKTFSTSYSQRMHLQTHTHGKAYSCDTCGLKCYTKGQLTQHRQIHTGIKPFTCTVCGTSCLRSREMIKHMNKHHSVEKTQQCIICKQLIPEPHLVTHMEIHDRRYSCYECGDTFYTQMDLTEHLKTHYGDKPHICSVCQKRFHIYAQLIVHLKTHSITVIADEM